MVNQPPPELQQTVAAFQQLSSDVAKRFRPTMQIMQQVAKEMEPVLRLAEQYQKALVPFFRTLQPQLVRLQEWTQTPNFKRYMSVQQCQTLLHPIYLELFEPEFSMDDIRENWKQIRQKLWKRFPSELDKNSRRERYNQILKCQTIGAYTPVCRSIYAELEALLRDELLFANPEWLAKWEDKVDAKSRTGFQSQQLKSLLENDHPEIKLLDENLSLSDIGECTCAFLFHLQEAFENFDPAKADHKDTKSFRHIHAHGWAKEATFMDALNGLLAFDMALELVAKINKENKQGSDNNDK